jgi:hypothetical protein
VIDLVVDHDFVDYPDKPLERRAIEHRSRVASLAVIAVRQSDRNSATEDRDYKRDLRKCPANT